MLGRLRFADLGGLLGSRQEATAFLVDASTSLWIKWPICMRKTSAMTIAFLAVEPAPTPSTSPSLSEDARRVKRPSSLKRAQPNISAPLPIVLLQPPLLLVAAVQRRWRKSSSEETGGARGMGETTEELPDQLGANSAESTSTGSWSIACISGSLHASVKSLVSKHRGKRWSQARPISKWPWGNSVANLSKSWTKSGNPSWKMIGTWADCNAASAQRAELASCPVQRLPRVLLPQLLPLLLLLLLLPPPLLLLLSPMPCCTSSGCLAAGCSRVAAADAAGDTVDGEGSGCKDSTAAAVTKACSGSALPFGTSCASSVEVAIAAAAAAARRKLRAAWAATRRRFLSILGCTPIVGPGHNPNSCERNSHWRASGTQRQQHNPNFRGTAASRPPKRVLLRTPPRKCWTHSS
mmetsp:Transcript_148465/g.386033  ORF Transcript_148465/g.386033 Transcript_148465/m.386033 type:complete len:408 (-) Transcript_148465:179-1402(-)